MPITSSLGAEAEEVSEFPLQYEDILMESGFYEVEGRSDVLLLVSDDKGGAREPAVLRVDGGKFYPASGWSGSKFRSTSSSVTLSA